ncbi:hypothetical protein [Paraburkholderia ginsengisoli]|uniref:Uncharacterized protein n=1 Tax=Paraburkholderia ginsengisoli TaxID=311231 RepID=A0A7T4N4R7_9BURK|nr:hypothetical protein [Paraburkholderia ginsengisoli]QQC65211.1 hypothetical protein I6I06_07055 [Paraburkholderia ginsengisoli]
MSRDVLGAGRREAVRRAAYSLADSGKYADWRAVEKAIRARYGVLDAHQLLGNPLVRTSIDQRCAAARPKPHAA